MFESMWSSMASSIQLAAECLKHESTTQDGAEQEGDTNMDGLEIFAHAIESSMYNCFAHTFKIFGVYYCFFL